MDMITVTVQEVIATQTASGLTMYRIKGSDGVNYGCGRNAPACVNGDTVTFEMTTNGNFKNVKPGTLKKASPAEVQQAPKAAPAASNFKAGQFREPDSIIYQESLGMAIDVTKFAIEQGALKLPAKANEKYGVLTSLIKELANEYSWLAKHPKIIDPEQYAMEQAMGQEEVPDQPPAAPEA